MAHRWGARRIAGQARAELVAAGAKPRRDAITGRDALTASELRVARLAAEGKTNRQIAQSLFITTKTASAHLSRVYRKLGRHSAEPAGGGTDGRGRPPARGARRGRPKAFPKARGTKDADSLPDAAARADSPDSLMLAA